MSPAREAALRLLRLMAAGTIIEETSMRQVLEALLLEEEKLLDQNRRLISAVIEYRNQAVPSQPHASAAIEAMLTEVAKEQKP